jgi:hypothetical protein
MNEQQQTKPARKPCGFCSRARRFLPKPARVALERVEQKMAAKREQSEPKS